MTIKITQRGEGREPTADGPSPLMTYLHANTAHFRDNIREALAVRHPEDIATLRAAIPLLKNFTDIEVEKLYESFSQHLCASWLYADPEMIQCFQEWLVA